MPLSARQLAAHLLERRDYPIPALTPQLALATITELKQHVDAEKLRNAHRALELAGQARRVATACPDPLVEALALWTHGNALYHLSRYGEALECYQQAEARYNDPQHRLQKAGMQLNQVAVLQDMGEFATALSVAAQARAICQQLGEPAQRYLASLEMNVGAAYQQIGDLAAALTAYDRARAIFAVKQEVVEAARLDINRANVVQEMGQFAAAEDLYRQARATLAAADNTQEVARTDYNRGVLAYRRGQYQAALRHLEAAHMGFAAIPNLTEVAMVDLFRSFVYRDLNLLHETITLADEAESVFKRERIRWLRAMALINQGVGYQRLGVYPLAEQLLARARRLLQGQGASHQVVAIDADRAGLALAAGQAARAQRLVRRVVRQIDPATRPALATRVYILLARCALLVAPANHPMARQHAEHACAIAQRYALPEQAAAAHSLGQVLQQTGDIRASWQQYQTALATIEQLRARLPLDDVQLGFMDDKLAIYDDAVQLAQQLATPAQVFALLNMAQTAPIARLAPLETASDPPPADDGLRAQLQALREQWHWHQRTLEASASLDADGEISTADQAALQQTLRTLEAEIADLVRRQQIRTSAVTPTAAAALPSAPPFDATVAATFLADVQRQLAPNTAVLHYFVNAGQLGVVLVTQTAIQLVPALVPANTLQRTLRSWRFQLEHGRTSTTPAATHPQTNAHLRKLYQGLVAPLEQHLHAQDHLLLVIPPGWHDLPFAALHDGQRYLVERWQVAYLSAPEVLLSSRPTTSLSAQTSNPQALVIGFSEAGRLPHTLVEAERVAATVQPTLQATCLLEEQATLAQLHAHIRQSKLLHVATHALFRPDNPMFSWMRLADARLTLADLYEMTLPQRPLVVLSACETGRGHPRGGGLLGMARGFLAAGAAGLIVSLWKIEDQTSAQVMVDLYTHLITAEPTTTPAAALCHAQRQACARGEHPFNWASFIFIQG